MNLTKKTLLSCFWLVLSLTTHAIEPVEDFIANYSGTASWDSETAIITITSSGLLRFADKGTRDFIWDVPADVKEIYIKANVTIDAGFHVNGGIRIHGEDRATSVIFGTDTQAWPLVNGLEGKEQQYAQIQAEESKWAYFVMYIDNLTILNSRSYAVRCWDRPAHMSNCNVIDNRGGWKNHSDGFAGGHFSTVTNCYFETGDDVIKIYKDLKVKNCTIKMILNAVPFQLGWGTYGFCRAEIEDVTIIGNSGRGEWEGSAPIIQWQGGNDKRTVIMKNCHFDVPHASLLDLNPSGGGLDLDISNSYINVKKYAYQVNAWGKRTICGENEPSDKNFWDDTQAPYIDIVSKSIDAITYQDGEHILKLDVSDQETSVAQVKIFLDGQLQKTYSSGKIDHTFSSLTSGNHQVKIEAKDTEGNQSYRRFNFITKCLTACDTINLLQNPDMEGGKDPWIENVSGLWYDTLNAYNGNASLQVNHTYNSFGNQGVKQRISQQLLAYGQGTYKVSAWVKQDKGDPVKAYASVFIKRNQGWTPNNDPDPNFKTPVVTLSSTEWTEITDTLNITWNDFYYAWFTVVSPTDNTTNFYVDKCTLQPLVNTSKPIVNIISPTEGESFDIGEDINVTIHAVDYNGSIDSLIVSLDGKVIEFFDTAPYVSTLEGLISGWYELEVTAIDNEGNRTTNKNTFQVGNVRSAYQTFQAESYDGASAGLNKDNFCVPHLGQIDSDEWLMYTKLDFGSTKAICKVNAAAGYNRPNARIELYLDSLNTQAVCTIPISNTGDWCNYQVFSSNFDVSGIRNVYLKFKGGNDIFDLDWVKFEPNGPATYTNAMVLSDEITIYPNPAINVLNVIDIGYNRKYPFEIYNMQGQLVFGGNINASNNTIDISFLPKGGIYIIKLQKQTGTTLKKLIVK